MQPVRIVVFTHYFPPEGNAPASRTYDHCVRWVAAGNQVTVITCVPNVPDGIVYPGYRNRIWPQRETVDGIDVLRVWSYIAANAGGAKRIANYLSYLFSAVIAFVFSCRRPEVVIATSPQFFCGWAGVVASWLKWCPFILEIRDIWPESIVTVGAMRRGLATRVLEHMEKWMYRSANHVVAVGEGYKQNILAKVPLKDGISVVSNGVDPNQFEPMPASAEFSARFGLQGRFACAYVGTIGMAHGLEVVVRAARRLAERNRHDIVFLLVGDGANRAQLAQLAADEGVQELVRFTGRLDKSDMPTVLASSACLLVHLKKSDLFETVIPSKIFEAMAMQRPLIMGVRGESAEIVRRSGCGIQIEPENVDELVAAVTRLCDDHEFYESRCQSARQFVIENYSRDRFAADFLKIIQAVVGRNQPRNAHPPSMVVQRGASE